MAVVQPDDLSAGPNRRALLAACKDTVSTIEALLFRLDPIGINFEDNTDEYRAEAETIARRIIKGRPLVTPPGTSAPSKLSVDFPSCAGLAVTPVVPGRTGGLF
jgi:hypothetical protein